MNLDFQREGLLGDKDFRNSCLQVIDLSVCKITQGQHKK